MANPAATTTQTEVDQAGESPLSLAFLSPGWPPEKLANGVIPYVKSISREARRLGHSTTILAMNVLGDHDPNEVSNLRKVIESQGVASRLIEKVLFKISVPLALQRQATRAITRECHRLIESKGLQLIELEEAFGFPCLLRRGLKLPQVVRLHGPWFLNGPLRGAVDDSAFRERVELEGRSIAEAEFVTSPSLDVLERTRRYYGLALKNAVVFPPPSAMVPESERWTLEGSDPDRVLFVGRFDLHKGGDLMIDAFAEIARRRPKARLWFAGPDPGLIKNGRRYQIADYIREFAPVAASRIDCLGHVANTDLASYRRQARVTVVSSRFETFGLTLTESMMMGAPTVATRAGAFPEIAEDGVNGLLFEAESPADLTEKIDSVLSDDALATRLGQRAALDAAARYNASNLVVDAIGCYRQVVGSGNAARR